MPEVKPSYTESPDKKEKTKKTQSKSQKVVIMLEIKLLYVGLWDMYKIVIETSTTRMTRKFHKNWEQIYYPIKKACERKLPNYFYTEKCFSKASDNESLSLRNKSQFFSLSVEDVSLTTTTA